jgi:hypothetical protein
VDPIPDPLLVRKFGSGRNRTRQELWPLDHRGHPLLHAFFKYLTNQVAQEVMLQSCFQKELDQISGGTSAIFTPTGPSRETQAMTAFPSRNAICICTFSQSISENVQDTGVEIV